MWKREDGGVYIPKQGKQNLKLLFSHHIYIRTLSYFMKKTSFVFFSFLNFNGMIVQLTAAIFKNKNGMPMLRMEMIPFNLEHQFKCLNRQLQASWQGDTEHLL